MWNGRGITLWRRRPAVPNYKMAEPGHSFCEGSVNLSWGLGADASDVISVPLKEQTTRFKQRILSGVIVETKEAVTPPPEETDLRSYRLMTGEAARAHKAIPAGPVTRNVFNPATGELMEVAIGSPKIVNEQLERAKAAQQAQTAALAKQAGERAAASEPETIPDDPADITSPALAE